MVELHAEESKEETTEAANSCLNKAHNDIKQLEQELEEAKIKAARTNNRHDGLLALYRDEVRNTVAINKDLIATKCKVEEAGKAYAEFSTAKALEISELRKQLSAAQTRAYKAEMSLSQVMKDYSSKHMDPLQRDLNKATKEMEEAKRQHVEVSQDNAAKSAEIDKLGKQLAAAKEETDRVAKLQAKVQNAASTNASEIRQLKASLTETKSIMATQKLEVDTLREDLAVAKQEIEGLDTKLDVTKQETQQVTKQYEEALAADTAHVSEIKELKIQAESSAADHTMKIDTLMQQLARAETKAREANRSLARTQLEAKAKAEEIRELKESLAEIEENLWAQQRISAGQIERLKKHVAEQQSKTAKKSGRDAGVMTSMAELVVDVEEDKKESESAHVTEAEKSTWTREKPNLKTIIQSLSKEIEDYKYAVLKCASEKANLESQLGDLKNQHEKDLETQITALKKKHAEEMEIREPLLQVGIGIRLRFMELTRRARIHGEFVDVNGQADLEVVEQGNVAAHRGISVRILPSFM